MSSGVRFTVAVIVVAMVAVGLYYARLEKPAEPAVDEVARMPESSGLDTITTEPSTPPVVREPEPTPSVPIVAAPTVKADQLDGVDPTPTSSEKESSEAPDIDAERGPGTNEHSAGSDATDATDATNPPEAEAIVAPTGLSRAYGPSLGVRETGVSLFSAVPSDDGRIEKSVARTNLETAVGNERPTGTEGTLWLPLAPWNMIQGSGEVEGLVVGTRRSGDSERRFLLVRDDSVGGLRLDGRIAGATVREDAEGRPEVAYLLEADAVDEVRESTFNLVGGTVAWVVDGEVISTPTLRIAIQNRGQIVGGFDREHATWIATRLRGELMARPGTVVDTPDDEPVVAEAPSAAGLPADAYTPYTIQSGDSFEGIAVSWFGDPQKQSLIAMANPTVDPLRLQVGQIIKLPPKNSVSTIRRANPAAGGEIIHTVQSGETLSDISLEYFGKASRWQEIHDANLAIIGDDPGNLKVGMEIVIP
jgi:LysM repeat protein